MRDYKKETFDRVEFIKEVLKNSGAKGIIYGNSGGKDCTLVGILCKMATDNVLGVMMPCQSKRNYTEDMEDGLAAANQYNIETVTVDITDAKLEIKAAIEKVCKVNGLADANINPRLRMITLYSLAQEMGYLVAGTGNRSERYMGYFTTWGDGACDFNPISDLTVKEIYEFLDYLKAPENIIKKAPSAALYEGQTDEKEMGISYEKIDNYILNGVGEKEDIELISKAYNRSKHKRTMPLFYKDI